MKYKAVSKAVGLRRILKLADYVEKIPRPKFNFNHFVGIDWEGAPDLSCGTSACAFGHASAMPFFQKLGVYLKRSKGCTYAAPALKGSPRFTFEHVSEIIFGLDAYETHALFIPGYGYGGWNEQAATPKGWARYARKFVARRQRESD